MMQASNAPQQSPTHLQVLMQQVDWSSMSAVSKVLASSIADPESQPLAPTVASMLLGANMTPDNGGGGSPLVSGHPVPAASSSVGAAANGNPSSVLLRLMRETMMDAFRQLELLVHPCLNDNTVSLVACTDALTSESVPMASPGGVVDPLVCPLCLAAAVGRDDYVSQFLANSMAAHRHAVIAARTALWNRSLTSATVLCHVATHCRVHGASDAASASAAPVLGPHKVDARLVSFLVVQLHWIVAAVALGDCSDASGALDGAFCSGRRGCAAVVSEGTLLGALRTLFAVCATDNDTKQLVSLLTINLPQLAAHGGTLVHALVRAKAHACLRFVLEQCRLATVALRRSLKSCSRLAVLRYDALNRRDAHGATPLSIAIQLHDATSARLLLLHGASAHARARLRHAEVALYAPLDLLHRHRCGTDMLRLFYPTAVEAQPHTASGAGGGVPSFEAVEDSLQQFMEGCLSRSSVGEILMDTAQRLLQHSAALKRPEGAAALRRLGTIRETALRTIVSALHADPWNTHISQALASCLHQEVVDSTASPTHRRVALHVHRMLSASGALQNTQSNSCAPPTPYDNGGVPVAEELYDGPYLLCGEESEGVETVHEKYGGGRAAPHAVVTHVKVLCPISCLPSQQNRGQAFIQPNVGEAPAGGGSPDPPCYVLWVRLSPLLGSMHPDDVVQELVEGHGFVEGCTAPGCPMQGGDLIFFAKAHAEDAMFVVTRCVQEGAVKVPRRLGQGRLDVVMLRRVRVGAWSMAEDALHYPDPTMWMERAKSVSFYHQVAHNAVHWKQLNAHVLRPDGHASFWAMQFPSDQRMTFPALADAIVCTPLEVPRSDPCFDPQFPWSMPQILALVNPQTEELIGFLPLM